MTELDRLQFVDEQRLTRLAEEASASPRKRAHILLHGDHGDQVQRLLIGLEPQTYVRPHVHSEQWEMLVLLRGRLDLLIFGPDARLARRLAMNAASPLVQIPRGTWHGAVALEAESLVLEVKPGPYRANEFAEWSPAEGEATAAVFVTWAGAAQPGSGWAA